jgi:hypothetical protein
VPPVTVTVPLLDPTAWGWRKKVARPAGPAAKVKTTASASVLTRDRRHGNQGEQPPSHALNAPEAPLEVQGLVDLQAVHHGWRGTRHAGRPTPGR